MTYSCTCASCRKPVEVEISDAALSMIRLPIWMNMPECNRCSDYFAQRRLIFDRIVKACRNVQSFKAAGLRVPDAELRNTKTVLEKLTKRFAYLVCDFNLVETTWDAAMVETCLDHPDRALSAMAGYESGMGKIALEARHQT